jgi:hypothetical protein
MNLFKKTAAVLVSALGLVACGEQQATAPSGGTQDAGGPAAEYCVERGGEYLAETGECRIGDGMVVDAEAFYQAHAGAEDAQ